MFSDRTCRTLGTGYAISHQIPRCGVLADRISLRITPVIHTTSRLRFVECTSLNGKLQSKALARATDAGIPATYWLAIESTYAKNRDEVVGR